MSKLSIARQIPFEILLKRIVKKVFVSKKNNYATHDYRTVNSSYKINSLIDNSVLEEMIHTEAIDHYLKHEFDLLGSGWVNRNTELPENQLLTHQKITGEIKKMVSAGYQFINWQLDVRSGFQFDVAKVFNNQKIDHTRKVDIKNCWELGRMQHLPQMAITAVYSGKKEQLITEFKNQCLDFIASNPVGMGVQWACAMDVGIRVVNLLVAYNIFNEMDEAGIMDNTFDQIFADAVYQHGVFIFNNLEQKEGAAGNHYLFNLVGLLFVSNYLSTTSELNKWKAFAEEELEKEFYKQFFNDGGNFEGSTTYHCLSTEAMVYATALMLRSNKPIDNKYIDLLYKAGEFVLNVSKPNGDMPQFGDNDSGRLFKFSDQQNLLNYESLLAAFSGIFQGNDFDYFSKKYQNHKIIAAHLSRNKKLIALDVNDKVPGMKQEIPIINDQKTTIIDFPIAVKTEKIKHYIYPDFGISIFKSDQFYLAVSTISNRKMHHSWGHVHNDKLSFELQVNGVDLVKDPGTYTYSADPMVRNEFRTTQAHHGIIVEGVEQNKPIDLFYMEREVKCELLDIEDLLFIAKATYYGVQHIRKFEITDNQIIITDYCNHDFTVNINKFDQYSPNYGIKQ